MTDDMFGLGKWLGNYFLSHEGGVPVETFMNVQKLMAMGIALGATGRPLPKAMTKRLSPPSSSDSS
jgi:hypothetical protein